MSSHPSERRSVWLAIGPGILFAGAAVGVSHLVQSTRAGASYGLALVIFVLFANVLKYPAFRFGPEYAAATGTSLLEGYRRQGRWALVLYGLLTLGTMFTVEAAVAVVTGALAKVLFGLTVSPVWLAAGFILVCCVLLSVGRYRWLDRVSKVVVAILTVATVAATVLALPRLDLSSASLWPSASMFEVPHVLFVAALIGWMPSAIDVAVWQSLWTLARARDTGQPPSWRGSSIDFHVGYLGTVALALCFVILGAVVMFGSGVELASSAGGFAAQVLALYGETLGSWSIPIIGTAALGVMFSTTLTVVDGFPRAISALVARFQSEEPTDAAEAEAEEAATRRVYWAAMAVLAAGSIGLLAMLLDSLTVFVDLATTLSFLTAPALAWLNHRSMFGDEVPAEARPSQAMRMYSAACVALLGAFALYYLVLRFS